MRPMFEMSAEEMGWIVTAGVTVLLGGIIALAFWRWR
jgi:hypothetical protein